MIETKISRWGNSQGIRIPKSLLKDIGFDNPINQEVQLSFDQNSKAILIKKEESTSRLMQKFGNQIELPKQDEFDWGEDVGNEIIK